MLEICIGENEYTKYWFGTLNKLKNLSVKDILIIYSNDLKEVNKVIKAVYSNSMQQRCIIFI